MEFLRARKGRPNVDYTVLMDENAVYVEDPRCQTVDVTGVRHVALKSTGFASMRIAAVLAVTGLGRKLPPLIVWKGANRGGSVERIGNTYVTYRKGLTWLDLVSPPSLPIFDASTPGKAIVWDSMRAHTSKAVKARVVKKNLQMFVIPGGLTPYLQTGDIGIYKSFKDKLLVIIDEWKSSDRVVYTEAGNPKQPPVEDVVQWVQTAWKAVPGDVVSRSVAAAGFSPSFEDWHISCHDVYGELFCRSKVLA